MENANVEAGAEAIVPQTPDLDTSQGFPVGSEQVPVQQEAPPEAPAAAPVVPQEPQTPAEAQVSTPEELQAANNRLKQINARHAKVISAVGLDPLADLGEQLETGAITPDMVQQHVLAQHRPPQQAGQPQVSNDPVSVAEQMMLDAKAECEKEGTETGNVSFQTMTRYNDAVIAFQDVKARQVQQELADRDARAQANANVDAVLSVARQNEYYNGFDDETKQISDFAHVAMTRAIAEREAPGMGIDPMNMNTQQYQYFANKAAQSLGRLAGGVQGRQPAPAPLQQPVNRNVPIPAGPGGGVVPPPNPFAGVNHTNHQEVARRYIAGQSGA